MDTIRSLAAFGQGAERSRLPVAKLGEAQTVGWAIINTYFQELLGPRTFGSVLNVGAGRISNLFRQAEMFAADEYHTLETPDSDLEATYRGYAQKMDAVPDNRYDWVISTAVLEHVTDPFAVAREKIRITKPGGFIYTLAPFAHQVHVDRTYDDYWRFSAAGLAALFPECRLREVEVWGDDPIMAGSYAVVVQKPPYEAAETIPHLWYDIPNELAWHPLTPNASTLYQWPIYQLTKSVFFIAAEMHALRDGITKASGAFIPIRDITRGSMDRYAQRVGTFGFRGVTSFLGA
jgi:SAM-dependent methyltransferase